MFGVTILGNNSALPAYDRHPTAQAVTLYDQIFLIDCGEGTQMQIAKYKVKRSKINHIFISHLHGDHYFGLPGLITSMSLLEREHGLHIYAPAALEEIIKLMFNVAGTQFPFPIHFHTLKEEGILIDAEKFSVECFKVYHRIECWGFLIREKKKPRRINKETITNYSIPPVFYERLQEGMDYVSNDGSVIKNELVTIVNTPAKSYAFCADTLYAESIACKVKNVTLLYHETTYLKDLEQRAASRYHSTTIQAAKIAALASAERLLIGHFSSKYETLDAFLEEVKEVFPNVELGLEGVTYRI